MRGHLVVWTAVAWLMVGCSDGGSGECEADTLRRCTCAGGGAGLAECDPSSGEYGACECGGGDAGSDDAGSDDAGSDDAGSDDAGSSDAGSSDAGQADAGPELSCSTDSDRDGFVSDACCDESLSVCGDDCDDANPRIRPGWPDGPPSECNGVDDDCDGMTDEGCMCLEGDSRECGSDAMRSGTGVCRPGVQTCVGGMFGTCVGGVPPREELCNSLDDDCDGTLDEGVLTTFYRDLDGDGFGDSSSSTLACAAPAGHSSTGSDCDDTSAAVHPGAVDVCNLVDDDCNGVVDDPPACP